MRCLHTAHWLLLRLGADFRGRYWRMREFVPECVRQFCFCVFDKRCVCAFNYYHLSTFLSSFICFIRNQNWRELEAKIKKYLSIILWSKWPNFSLSFVSEIHDYETRSAYFQHLNTCTFRINIRRFCPTVIGCYYWNDIPISMREKPNRKLSKVQFLCIISLSIY